MSEWWESAPLVNPAPQGGGNWWEAAPIVGAQGGQGGGKPADPASMSWGEVGSQAIQNAPASAGRFIEGVAQPFMHPVDTAKALSNVGTGAIAMGGSALAAAVPSETLPEKTFGERYQHGLNVVKEKSGASEAYPEAVGKYFTDRYGSMEGFKKALATDPVGVAGDLSAVLTAGGGAAAKAPGIVGKVGETVRAAGDVANPLMGPAKAAGAVGDEAARIARPIEAPTTEALYEAASDAYKTPEIKDLAIKPSAVKQWKDELTIALNDEGFNDMLSPRTFRTLEGIDDAAKGSTFTGQGAETLRRTLRRAGGVIDPTEKEAARRAIESLDEFLGNVPQSAVLRGDPAKVGSVLKEARGNYAAAKRSEEIEKSLDKAALQAGAANSGMNLDNATRQRIKDILNSDKRKRGFSQDELTQMRKIVTGTKIENLARRGGNLLGGGGGLGSTFVGGLGALAGGSVGHAPGAALGAVVAPAVGYGLKKLSGAMSQADVRKLQELVRSRSPLGEQMQSSINKFGKASAAANASAFAAPVIALLIQESVQIEELPERIRSELPDSAVASI